MEVERYHLPWRFRGDVLRIFVGATSADLKSFRIRVRDVLAETGQIFADIQDIRPPDFKDIQVMLHNHISEADAVICLIGHVYGSEPLNGAALGPARRSYTQMEFDVACGIKQMPVFRFVATDNAKLDEFVPESPDLQRLQQNFRQEVREQPEQWSTFSSFEELEKLVRTAMMRVEEIWETRRIRRLGMVEKIQRPVPFEAESPKSPGAWKHAVALITCGHGMDERALGTAFCVNSKGQFLATSASVASTVAAALARNTPCRVLWEKHPRGFRHSRIEKAWPEGVLRIPSAEPAGAQLLAAEVDAPGVPEARDPLTGFVATTPQIAYSDWRVQIERVVGIVDSDSGSMLRIRSAVPELAGAVLSGAPLVAENRKVVAIIENAWLTGVPAGLVIEARGISALWESFPTIL